MKQVEGLKVAIELFDKHYSQSIRAINYCEGRRSDTEGNYSYLRYEITFEVESPQFALTTDYVRISVVEKNGEVIAFVM